MENKKYPYHEIKRIYEANSGSLADDLLNSGWILLDIEKFQTSEHDYQVMYILGNTNEDAEVPKVEFARGEIPDEYKDIIKRG